MDRAGLRLVVVRVGGEGDDLVSLALGEVLVSGDSLTAGDGVPEVYIGGEQEREACALAGQPYDEGWPGWDVILPWLEAWAQKRGY